MNLINKSVLFIDNSDSDFTGFDINTPKVRGTESSLILLAESFVKKNISVRVLTEVGNEVLCNGVTYSNKHKHKDNDYNLCIAISNANLFSNIKSETSFSDLAEKNPDIKILVNLETCLYPYECAFFHLQRNDVI